MPLPCTQFVLGCGKQQYLSWQQLLFSGVCCLGKKPQRELSAAEGFHWQDGLFPHFWFKETDFWTFFFLKTKCQHLTAELVYSLVFTLCSCGCIKIKKSAIIVKLCKVLQEVIKNRLSVTRNSRKSLLPKQVFSIILSLRFLIVIIYSYSITSLRDVSESSLFFLWGTSRSLFIWTLQPFSPPNFIFGCCFFFLTCQC